MIQFIVEYGLFFILFCFLISQVIVPLVKGRKMFPLFGKERKIEKMMTEKKQAMHEKEMRSKVNNLDFTNRKEK